jgi:hypothetical protein
LANLKSQQFKNHISQAKKLLLSQRKIGNSPKKLNTPKLIIAKNSEKASALMPTEYQPIFV